MSVSILLRLDQRLANGQLDVLDTPNAKTGTGKKFTKSAIRIACLLDIFVSPRYLAARFSLDERKTDQLFRLLSLFA